MDIGSTSTISWCFLWLVALLSLKFSIFHVYSKSQVLCIPSEREALLKLKHDLEDPSDRLSSWVGEGDCCYWYGVVCNNLTGRVIELHLATSPPSYDAEMYHITFAEEEAYERSMFGGDINPSLLNLKDLSYLDLSGNDFGGNQIPTSIGSMSKLRYLDLSEAGFSGLIPHQIGNLSNLQHLNLRGDYHELFAEDLQWLSGISKLEYLDLSYVNLSKASNWLQITSTLPSLVELHLSHCSLDYHFESFMSFNFSSLVVLDLSKSNFFNHPFIPRWIFGLKLVSLDLSGNGFRGEIPAGFKNMTGTLEHLDLSFNSYNGSIPSWLSSFGNLKSLNLTSNNLNGQIPSIIANLTSLVRLNMADNQFEGSIPRSLGGLCKLRKVDFSGSLKNQKVQDILEALSGCITHGLEELTLDDCKLSGCLTNQICKFKNLFRLSLSNNSIQGPILGCMGNLSSMKYLDLSSNNFSGTFPEFFGGLPQLLVLVLGGNKLEGLVTETHLNNLTNLRVFHAPGNWLVLNVSHDWIPSFHISWLSLSSWYLGTQFPSWLSSQKRLRFLDISNTGISDAVPTWFWTSNHEMFYLNLSHNKIHGEIPKKQKDDPIIFSTVILDVSSNNLTGPLPRVSSNMVHLDLSSNMFSGSLNNFLCSEQSKETSLEFLILAKNQLSGEIPDCWKMWPSIVIMNLENNYFTGNLPSSIGTLNFLQSLHLRHNELTGKFPFSLKNNVGLIILDLGENNLSGVIPSWVGEELLNLKLLSLRSNMFYGHVPLQICSLSSLQILDIAQNNLSGHIPQCLGNSSALILKQGLNPHINAQSRITYNAPIENGLLLMKGEMKEYSTFLGLVTSIDLSDNKISGEIPEEISNLSGLLSLNLSRNFLRGEIPNGIGKMSSLESLDLSMNKLSGEIPPSMAELNFLSKMNLSYNKLKGKIPTGTQLQSLEASSFTGNNLCGAPLLVNCSGNSAESPNVVHEGDQEGEGHVVDWPLYVSIALGFIVGFWGVMGPLLVNRWWRHVYFHFFDRLWDKLRCC